MDDSIMYSSNRYYDYFFLFFFNSQVVIRLYSIISFVLTIYTRVQSFVISYLFAVYDYARAFTFKVCVYVAYIYTRL